MIKLGSSGDNVKTLQTKLGLTPDGDFGPATEKAVKVWQEKNGLTADGIVGNTTWSKLGLGATVPNILNTSKLKGVIPDTILAQIPEVIEKFDIDTPLRLAHFLAQCSHESANFSILQENLNYSGDRLKVIFPKYFPGNLSESYSRNPEKIASKVYGGRMGNGDEATKDGYKFRGRGAIQLTGKDNYKAFGKAIGVDLLANPDLVSTKYSLVSAAWFFKTNCVKKCDAGATKATIESVSKCVNGGTIGLSHRIEEFNKFYKLLS